MDDIRAVMKDFIACPTCENTALETKRLTRMATTDNPVARAPGAKPVEHHGDYFLVCSKCNLPVFTSQPSLIQQSLVLEVWPEVDFNARSSKIRSIDLNTIDPRQKKLLNRLSKPNLVGKMPTNTSNE